MDNKRSKRAEKILYYKKNPYKLIKYLYGENLHLYQKLWIKFIILTDGDNYGKGRREDCRRKKKNS